LYEKPGENFPANWNIAIFAEKIWQPKVRNSFSKFLPFLCFFFVIPEQNLPALDFVYHFPKP